MKILIYDHGLCTEGAIKLAADGHKVAYFTPWQQDFPEHGTVIGRDLEGLERVEQFQPALERCDLVVCFDTYSEDRVLQARAAGKPVFGAGKTEELELDRIKMKKLQERLGLPTQPWQVIHGINKLIDFLKTAKKKWVKASGKHRGLIETFYIEEWNTVRSMELGQMMADFGPIGDSIDFLIEDPVGDCEPGYDGFFVGQKKHLFPALIGYEAKDESYLGKVFNECPKVFQPLITRLSPILDENSTSSLVSYEVRIDKKKDAYLIDPCFRAPHPPFAVELETYENFSEIVVQGAVGISTTPQTAASYGAAIEIKSSWVTDHYCKIEFDPKYRSLVKLQRACRDRQGNYWAIPGSFVIATCVGLGDTAEAAVRMAKKVADTVKAKGMYYDAASLDNLLKKTVPEGEKYGIPF